MTPPDQEAELLALRAEVAELGEQVKLLVRTEQRLYRSQNEFDAQLGHLRALARFALECTGDEAPSTVLARALRLLEGNFAIDAVVAVECCCDAARFEVSDGFASQSLPVDPSDCAWLAGLAEPRVMQVLEAGPAARCTWAAVAAAAEWRMPFELVVVPFALGDGGRRGALVLASRRPRPPAVRDSGLGEEHKPFLQLLALHLERALATARLTERLRERSEQLTATVARLEQTQAALVEAQKLEAVGRLAGGIAHDFNNLLTVIVGCGEELLQGGREPEVRQSATSIVDAARRAARITQQLLAFGRRQVRQPVPFDLGAATGAAMDVLRRLLGPRVDVALVVEPGVPPIEADPAQFEQVLLNLVVNARDAMADGGRLRVRTRRADSDDAARCIVPIDAARFAVLEVEDTGCGMDAATMARVFEPFFSTKGQVRHAGLGLAVVYGIVQQGGGQILLDSELGRGTRFRVLFPLATAGTGGPPSGLELPRRGPILVVEDDDPIRALVTAHLVRAGHAVRAAASAEAALEVLAGGFRPALLLTDVMLPGRSGTALAAAVAQDLPECRIAFMTGFSQELAMAGDGGRPVLHKPFGLDELLAFVGRCFDSQAPGVQVGAS